jgi:hypothetical protein
MAPAGPETDRGDDQQDDRAGDDQEPALREK